MRNIAVTLISLNLAAGIFLMLFILTNVEKLEKEPEKLKSSRIFWLIRTFLWLISISDETSKWSSRNKFSILALIATVHFVISINLLIRFVEVNLKWLKLEKLKIVVLVCREMNAICCFTWFIHWLCLFSMFMELLCSKRPNFINRWQRQLWNPEWLKAVTQICRLQLNVHQSNMSADD